MIESETFHLIQDLVQKKIVLISSHGYDELAEDNILVEDILNSIQDAIVIEDYPEAFKGRSVLLLQKDKNGSPVHTVWGIPKAKDRPAVLITAYIPNQEKWNTTCTQRR